MHWCIAVLASATAFVVPVPQKRAETQTRAIPIVDDVGLFLSEPVGRFSLLATFVGLSFYSQVTHSSLAKPRPGTKPEAMNETEWRSNEVMKWRLDPDKADRAVHFLQEWAKFNAKYAAKASSYTVEDLDRGVRIKFVPHRAYYSADEEKNLEKTFERRAIKKDLSLVPMADSIYNYPRRKTRQSTGGLDVVVSPKKADSATVSASRSAYAKNAPIKYTSEKRLLSQLTHDLAVAYEAEQIRYPSSDSSS